jgi:hypothetical protein
VEPAQIDKRVSLDKLTDFRHAERVCQRMTRQQMLTRIGVVWMAGFAVWEAKLRGEVAGYERFTAKGQAELDRLDAEIAAHKTPAKT